MSPESKEKLPLLKDRAKMLASTRAFFAEKNVLEVDPYCLNTFAALDTHIDPLIVSMSDNNKRYLHTSPEYAMKRLLSMGAGDIYYLGHVFRKEEIGDLHTPEFTMIEWYREDISYKTFLEEIKELIFLFIQKVPCVKYSYSEVFYKFANLDHKNITSADLHQYLIERDIETPFFECKNDYLHLIMSYIIEPNLPKNRLIIIDSFPKSMAALAKINEEGEAQRFEFYFNGIELANGFFELNDTDEQKKRFEKANKERKNLHKQTFPLDIFFLKSLEKMKDCYGIAVGFDRLMMLRHKKNSIHEIMPISWDKS